MDVQFRYRNAKLGGSSSSDSDSDSNDDSDVWKRHTSKPTSNDRQPEVTGSQLPSSSAGAAAPMQVAEGVVGNPRKRKVNKIWSSVLEEESVVSELCQIGLTAKLPDTQNRTCEKYDYTLKYSDPRREQVMDTDSSANDISEDTALSDDTKGRRLVKKAKRYRSTESLDSYVKQNRCHNSYKWSSEDTKRFPKLSNADVEVARKIVHTLGEKKYYLIHRVVHVIGAEKAMELLRMTEDVENNGGMLIKNNSRRRTPGGVYLQLLKADKNISAEQVNEIFAHEVSMEKVIEYRKMKNKLKKNGGNYREKKKKKSKSKNKNAEESMVCDEAAPVSEMKAEASLVSVMKAEASPVSEMKTEASPISEMKTEAPDTLIPQLPPSLFETSDTSKISISGSKVYLVDSDIEEGEILDN